MKTVAQALVFWKTSYEKLGAETMQGGAEEMRHFQAPEIEHWKRLAIKAKVQQE